MWLLEEYAAVVIVTAFVVLNIGVVVRLAVGPSRVAIRGAEESNQPHHEGSVSYGPALKYSSPWPWVLAIVISGAMWVGIGWLIWKLI